MLGLNSSHKQTFDSLYGKLMWALVYNFKGFSLLFAFVEVYSVNGVCFFKGWQYDNGHI